MWGIVNNTEYVDNTNHLTIRLACCGSGLDSFQAGWNNPSL
jgi:hypothetical protein